MISLIRTLMVTEFVSSVCGFVFSGFLSNPKPCKQGSTLLDYSNGMSSSNNCSDWLHQTETLKLKKPWSLGQKTKKNYLLPLLTLQFVPDHLRTSAIYMSLTFCKGCPAVIRSPKTVGNVFSALGLPISTSPAVFWPMIMKHLYCDTASMRLAAWTFYYCRVSVTQTPTYKGMQVSHTMYSQTTMKINWVN